MHNISKSELGALLDQKADILLVNVLPKESFTKQHIPSSISIPYKDNPSFVQQVKARLSPGQQVIVYCANKNCDLSKRAAQTLQEAGLERIDLFEEGVEGWFASPKAAA